MKLTDEDKRLLGVAHKLESRKCREMLSSYANAMYLAQEALKVDYGLLPESIPAQTAGGKPAV